MARTVDMATVLDRADIDEEILTPPGQRFDLYLSAPLKGTRNRLIVWLTTRNINPWLSWYAVGEHLARVVPSEVLQNYLWLSLSPPGMLPDPNPRITIEHALDMADLRRHDPQHHQRLILKFAFAMPPQVSTHPPRRG